MKILPRAVEPALAERLRVMPAVVVTGARQTGKSTWPRSASPDPGATRHSTIEYDFGDDGRHAVTFEGTDELRKGERALACLASERRCPREDCGGIYGYTELLDILTNPGHEEHQPMLEWLGGPYDPEAFLGSGRHIRRPAGEMADRESD